VATEVHKVQVGVFVIVATTIGIGALIWLGASRFFEDTEPFVTYFGESVQGLDPGASVKYRGVPAGRVGKISIAPDGRLIQVEMDINVEAGQALKRDPSLRASLELSGITGLRYVGDRPALRRRVEPGPDTELSRRIRLSRRAARASRRCRWR
jgi:phospholipid/cholesterol/gamma-HCH transport system substrate-binding protein